MKSAILLRLDPETKEKLKIIAKSERRSLSSLIILLIDKKIEEIQNGS